MSYEDRNAENRTYNSFRTSLDLGMGVIYLIIGGIILYVKYFGTMELSSSYAYILGGLMIVYGLFRIYRGFQAMKQRRR